MCNTTGDCPGNLFCQPGDVSWAPASANGSRFCSCDVLWGHLPGDDPEFCTEYGPHAIYSLTVSAVSMVMTLLLLIYAGATLVGLYKAGRRQSNDTVVTVILSFCGSLSYFLWKVPLILQVVTPEEQVEVVGQGKRHPSFVPELVLIAFTFFLIILALSNVSLVWIDVVTRTQAFRVDGGAKKSPRIIVRGFQGSVTVALLISMIIGGPLGFFIAGLITTLGIIGLMVITFVARLWFERLLVKVAQMGVEERRYLLKRIIMTTAAILVCCFISTLGFLGYGLSNLIGIAYVCPLGEVCIEIVLRDVGSTSAFVAMVIVTYYCRLCLGFQTIFAITPVDSKRSSRETANSGGSKEMSPKRLLPPKSINSEQVSGMEGML